MLSERTSNALAGVSKATLKKEVRVKHLFRIMTHCPDLWMEAYAKVYANQGAMTQGVNENTLDGMCRDRIDNLIALLKDGRYKPSPVKRVYIPKRNGKLRPLGMPTGDDKLVQEVIKSLLELVYEPIFSERSHGFRSGRSCHTALTQVKKRWKGVKWAVDMDISGFYDNIDHQVMIDILEKKIDDRNFISLIKMFLQAGYLENWTFHGTYSGTPQGGICSPVLSNIFLHELDGFMEQKISEFNKGKERTYSLAYARKIVRNNLRKAELKRLEKQGGCFPFALDELSEEIKTTDAELKKMPSRDPNDPNFRRLQYVRYADDFVMGISGPKEDAERIAAEVERFLNEKLKLTIAKDKFSINHVKEGFDFLGYHLSLNLHNNIMRRVRGVKAKNGRRSYGVTRTVTTQLRLQVPIARVWEFCKANGYLKENRPTHRANVLHLSDYEILDKYNAEMRGFANYYALAPKADLRIMEWAGRTSFFRTLANKHKTSAQKLRSGMKFEDEHLLRYTAGGKERVLKVFKLKHLSRISEVHVDRQPLRFVRNKISEITKRMNASQCEYCGKQGGYFEVHHVKKLRDVRRNPNKKPWELEMLARRRKTLVLCIECHDLLHKGELQGWKRNLHTKMESRVH